MKTTIFRVWEDPQPIVRLLLQPERDEDAALLEALSKVVCEGGEIEVRQDETVLYSGRVGCPQSSVTIGPDGRSMP